MPGTVLRIITRLNLGGPLRQLTGLVPRLPEHRWDGPVIAGRVERHEPDGGRALEDVGARLLRVRALKRGIDPSADARAFRILLAAIRHHRPDVVHTHTGKAGALGRLAARAAGVPAVHTYHGHHLESALLKAGLARYAEKLLGRITAAAVCLTPRQQRDVVDVHRVLPPERAHVIGPGMDLAAFRARARKPRPPAMASPDPERPHFLWTGRFVAVKDPARLVEAVALSEGRFRVTMLGQGPLLPGVRATVRAHSLEDRIDLPGAVEDVAPWLAAADGLVLCSRSEGAPLSVIEAMALGKPVVVTTVGGLPDLVAHERTGLWVPPRDALPLAHALDRLADDAALRLALGREAATGVDDRFGADRLAAETAALYEQVVAS